VSEEALVRFARDLVEEISAGRALALAGSPGLADAEGNVPGPAGVAGSPVPVPEARSGSGAVHPHLGHHLLRPGGDTISGHAHAHVPRPWEPEAPDAKTVALQQAKEELDKYGEWEEKVGDYQRATKELDDHSAKQAAQGIPLPGTYKPWTPDEHASHARYGEDALTSALRGGKATSQSETHDGSGQAWSGERAAMHNDLVHGALDQATDVPSGRKALLVGGLDHPAKRAVLKSHPSIKPEDYVHVDHNRIKEEMAKQGLVPEVKGLSPGEASPLVHEEAAHVGHLMTAEAMRRGKNLAIHTPMSDPAAVQSHAQRLKDAGYSVHGVFVHTPVDAAVDSARRAHKNGHEKYRQEKGTGARLPLPGILASAETAGGSSVNHDVFNSSKPQFHSWEKWSHDGKLLEKSEHPQPDHGIASAEELRKTLGR
jgi:hypothetical protein